MPEGKSPRILLTGFSSFPGVSANPTQALVEALRGEGAPGSGELHLATLAVEYRALPARLEALGREVRPDIALHFGVSGRATAFAIERTARNVVGRKPDNAGFVPDASVIRPFGEALPSGLPVEAIADALARERLPAAFSDDAGDYLCNTLFYLSCGRHCPPFSPGMAGFIHVPPFGTQLAPPHAAFDLALLVKGAKAILAACAEAWDVRESRKQKAALGEPGAAS